MDLLAGNEQSENVNNLMSSPVKPKSSGINLLKFKIEN
jgi:hypothetical protein